MALCTAAVAHDVDALTGCVSGAAAVDDLRALLEQAGCEGIEVTVRPESREFIRDWLPGSGSRRTSRRRRSRRSSPERRPEAAAADDRDAPRSIPRFGRATTTSCCPPAEPTPPVPADEAEANERLAQLATAIAHPARVAIVRLLVRQQGCIVGDIVDELPLAQSTVSQHLKQLKQAGLIRGEVDGPRVCYCVEPGTVALLKALVAAL